MTTSRGISKLTKFSTFFADALDASAKCFKTAIFALVSSLSVTTLLSECLSTIEISYRVLPAIFITTFVIFGATIYGSPWVRNTSKLTKLEYIGLLAIMLVGAFFYVKPNEVIIGGQDPSVYFAKAVTIIDHDSLHKPLPTWDRLSDSEIRKSGISDVLGKYNYLFNGIVPTKEDGKYILKSDFISGPVIMHVIVGMLSREMLLYGSVIIVWLSFFTFLMLVSEWANRKVAIIAVLLLMLNPAQRFFGLSTFSEIPSQLSFLACFLFFHIGVKYRLSAPIIAGLLVALCSLTIRLDNAVLFTLAICWCLLDGIGIRKTVIFALLGIAITYLVQYNHEIYTSRIYKAENWLNHQTLLFLGLPFLVFAFRSELISLLGRLSKLLGEVPTWMYCVLGIGIFCLLYLVRPSLEPYHERLMFGRVMRTYRENTMVNLSLVVGVPLLILFYGYVLIFFKTTLGSKDNRLKLFFFAMLAVYLFVMLRDSTASPQMYWSLRRFLPVVIPGLILVGLTCVFATPYRSIHWAVCTVLLILQVNIWRGTDLGLEMVGSVSSVRKFESEYGKDNVVYADRSFRHVLFALAYMGRNQVVPTSSLFSGYDPNIDKDDHLYLKRVELGDESIDFQYSRVGENYEELPVQRYDIHVPLLVEKGSLGDE